jgi:transposase-like protein
VLPEVREWRCRPLESAFVFLDAINYKIHEDGRVKNRAAYVALGVNLDGAEEVLGRDLARPE